MTSIEKEPDLPPDEHPEEPIRFWCCICKKILDDQKLCESHNDFSGSVCRGSGLPAVCNKALRW